MIYHGIPTVENLEKWVSFDIPFEYNDFMYPQMLADGEKSSERIKKYLDIKRDRSHDIIHGPFFDIAVHSIDPEIRRVSDMRIREAADIAEKMNVTKMVLHTNLIANFRDSAYRKGWVDRNEEYFNCLLEDYTNLTVYMENMFDEEPDCLAELAERMRGKRFKICLDIGHANLSRAGVKNWIDACTPYIAHYHLNDNCGIIDEHLPIGKGNINWKQVLPFIKKNASALIEVRSVEAYLESLEYINGQQIKVQFTRDYTG